MRTIYKYPVRTVNSFTVPMPIGAQILAVQLQVGVPQMWAQVDDEEALEDRHFVVRGTGHPFDGREGRYVGTYQSPTGAFVFHLFEGLVD